MLSPTLRRIISLSNPTWPMMIKPWYCRQTMQNPNINDMNIERSQVFFLCRTIDKGSQRPYQHDLTNVPQIPNPNGPLKLKLLDKNLRVEQRVWQALLAASRREHVIITQGKMETKKNRKDRNKTQRQTKWRYWLWRWMQINRPY